MNRSVLYLAYFFPPRGGAAVQRSVKFARYLPEFGWNALVVSSGHHEKNNVSKVQDPTLLAELPEGSIVRYTSLTAAEQREYEKSQSKWRQRLNVTDPIGWWAEPAIRLGEQVAAEHKPRAILVTMSPFTAARAGIELKRRTGLPLVFDLRDPWALDETRIYPTRWHASRDWAAMARAIGAADLVIMNTPQAAVAVVEEFAREIDDGGARKVIAITNGYDQSDFDVAAQPPAPADVLRIVHTGMFHCEWAPIWDDVLAGRGLLNRLKYPRRPVNLWTRTPRYLLAAMQRAVARGEIPAEKMELVLVGELSEADRAMIQASGAAPMVRMLGYRTHAESVGWIKSADVLFLPNHTPLDGGPTLVVPGKTYEYLGSGRPILAMCGPGDMRDFVRSSGRGTVLDGDDVAGCAMALVRMYREKAATAAGSAAPRAKEGSASSSATGGSAASAGWNPEAENRFERKQLTRVLAAALDEVSRSG